ncbi:hypothetical protein BDF20DRAFT_9981 [Mycotypha africana]|uniref:uncharacterized protein n=1 Tax=Mycotypha africana TaxID=64632 RepID=UPI0023007509|nr:uncharacterized protein BDF20DRAFT_9981 [Mycotypha africana]KAI8990923.1 hypothetical protein BDF20DRAFT_9981 [Mycotypha africana]
MALATFPLLIKRWKRSRIHHANYADYMQLADYLSEELFTTRLNAINNHVYREFPHVWIDSILFIVAILLVIVAAVFSVVARAVNLSMWYPLIILLAPAIIAFITTRRRNGYYAKLSQYYESLHSSLKEFNSLDVTRQIKWGFRRVRDTDTPADMHLKQPLNKYHINLVIEVIQIDTENELAEEGEMLPAYETAMMDVVLDVGPEVQQLPGNRSEYITNDGLQLTFCLPPAYSEINNDERRSRNSRSSRSRRSHNEEEAESIELQLAPPTQPPPAYINSAIDSEEGTPAPPNTVNNSTITMNH